MPPRPPAALAARLGPPPWARAALSPRTARWTGPAGSLIERRPDSPRKAHQEAAALRAWGPAARGPALLHADPDALWLEDLPGRPGAASDGAAVLRALGAACAGLDRGASPADPLPLDAALAQRAAALAGAPGGLLRGCAWGAWAAWARWPQHRDLAPRNWLVAADGVRLVDFEHARADAPGTDAARLWLELRLELDGPAAEAALRAWDAGRQAAGGPVLPPAEQLLDLCRLATAATLAWAARHADPTFTRRGEAWAALLRDGEGPPTLGSVAGAQSA
ncbi:MAG: Phosphotransferase enzyme family [Pseudomonadota bacterium]